MTKLLTREQILGANDLKKEIVSVPEWGGEVMVRGMTGAERDQFEARIYKAKGTNVEVSMDNIRALIVSLTVIDEDGNRLFTQQDVQNLAKKSAIALNRVAEVAFKLSGLSAKDQKALSTELKNVTSDNSTSN